MVYVQRNDDGNIVSISRVQDDSHREAMPSDAPEVAHFMGEIGGEQSDFVESDISLVRVLEDVIDLLIDRSVIRFTDLPLPAQEKLLHRRSIRDAFRNLNLLAEDDEEVI